MAKAFEPHFVKMGAKPDPDAVLSMTVCDPAMGSGAFLVEATRQLSDKLLEAWAAYPEKDPCQKLGADDRVFVAMRTVAQRCIYGVDRNPAAVDLAKMSMWLLTISKDHPFTFMDHSLKHGDALVGMSKEQIKKFHWDLSKGGSILPEMRVLDKEVEEAVQARLELRNLDADRTLDLEVKLAEADRKMMKAKQAGDLLVYAWFSNDKDKARNEARDRYTDRLIEAIQPGSSERKALDALRYAPKPLAPFHWELEFPEVFADAFKGFAVFVGNPPFAGKNTVPRANVNYYQDYLTSVLSPRASGFADLVAFFFNRAFQMLRADSEDGAGTMNLIATKTIRQGHTRESSLALIRKNGGFIYDARRRMAWPGKAAVVISTVAVSKRRSDIAPRIDQKKVSQISSFLIDAGADETPSPLTANTLKSFQGSVVLGMGFTFDDDCPEATTILRMNELLSLNPQERALIKVYVGGEQVNNQAAFSPQRYVIDFGEMPESEAIKHDALWRIVKDKVYPERAKLDGNKYPRRVYEWWKHCHGAPALYEAIQGNSRVLVANRGAAKFLTFSFLPTGCVYSDKLYVFSDSSYAHFAVVQSRVHELWARMFGTSLEDRLCYTGTSCYENFPFPDLTPRLEDAGGLFDKARSATMISLKLGLTPLGNRLNSPDNFSPEVISLREQLVAMDKAVLEAYGWTDIIPVYEFSGDYENEDGSAGSVRLNFTEEVRDEILRRLLALHAERLKAEQTAVPTAGAAMSKAKKPKKSKDSAGPDLFNL